ncbi:MAG: zinc ribbon domain-containing protein [Phaeodactylibacter sp.]|nr:zinc ribbon domain-containing protein [Phaeodactylibacter sp.]
MSRKLYDFHCPDGHVSELLVYEDVRVHKCLTCGKPAQRVISPVRSYLDPISGDFPGAAGKWARMRDKQIAHERKTETSRYD